MEKYIGIMSGTSLDGVDTALIETDGQFIKLLANDFYPIPASLKQAVLAICTGQPTTVAEVGILDHRLGKIFAAAVNQLLAKSALIAEDITAIGSHGQTVFHAPGIDTPFTIQLGDANLIAALTGITTIADFRRKDMALGGQGAPLVPAFHQVLFASLPQNSIILNIGGIANISIIKQDFSSGFDTGPGNVLMDAWISKQLNKPYDEDGKWAATGKVNQILLDHLLADNYFQLPAPKSTGRELFNLNWLEDKLADFSLLTNESITKADVQATLLALTAVSISRDIQPLTDNNRPNELLLCGGGAQNQQLVQKLKDALPNWQISNTQKYGIDADYMEAMAFAWLAHQTWHHLPGNLPAATGAIRPTILGGIYWP